MVVSKTSDHIQIKINMPNPSQEPPAPNKAPNQDLKDIDVLFTFKIKIESHIMGVSKTSENIQIKIKMPNPSQDHPVSFKAPNQELKDLSKPRAVPPMMGQLKTPCSLSFFKNTILFIVEKRILKFGLAQIS